MATKANLVIDQGADFTATITLSDVNGNLIDLTGFNGRSQIRKHYTSLTAIEMAIYIDVPTASVTLSLPAAQTGLLSSGRYVYDVELTNIANNVVRIIEGIVTVTPQVTR